MEWEVTKDDVLTVLNAHQIEPEQSLDELFDLLNIDEIVDNVMKYTKFDDQVASMLSDIEWTLMENGIVAVGMNKFSTQ